MPPSRPGEAVDADVDDRRAGLEPVALDHFGAADGGDDDVGAADDVGQVAGAAVGDGDGAAFAEQQQRHRLADDVGAADDDRVHAGKIAQLGLEQHQAAERRAGHEAVEPGRQAAGIDRVEAVDVLVGVDRG